MVMMMMYPSSSASQPSLPSCPNRFKSNKKLSSRLKKGLWKKTILFNPLFRDQILQIQFQSCLNNAQFSNLHRTGIYSKHLQQFRVQHHSNAPTAEPSSRKRPMPKATPAFALLDSAFRNHQWQTLSSRFSHVWLWNLKNRSLKIQASNADVMKATTMMMTVSLQSCYPFYPPDPPEQPDQAVLTTLQFWRPKNRSNPAKLLLQQNATPKPASRASTVKNPFNPIISSLMKGCTRAKDPSVVSIAPENWFPTAILPVRSHRKAAKEWVECWPRMIAPQ